MIVYLLGVITGMIGTLILAALLVLGEGSRHD